MGRLVVFGAAVFTPTANSFSYFNAILPYFTRPLYDPLDMTSDNKSVMGFNLIWLWEK